VTLPTAPNTSAPVASRYPDSRRVPPVLVDLGLAQHLSSITPTGLLRLVQEGQFGARKRTGQSCITRRSLDRLIAIRPTATCQ
jgi:hypothetical protein